MFTRSEVIVLRNKQTHKQTDAAENMLGNKTLTQFQNYFSDIVRVGKYSCAAISLRNNSEIISGKFSRDEIKLFRTDIDEC